VNQTSNLGLKMPGQQEFYNVDDFNFNAGLIDAKLSEIADRISNLQTSVPVSYFGISNMKLFVNSGTFSVKAGNVYKVILIGGGGGGQAQGGLSGDVRVYIHKPEEDMDIACTVGKGGSASSIVENAYNGFTSSYGGLSSAPGGCGGFSRLYYTSANFHNTANHSGQDGFIVGFTSAINTEYSLRQGTGYGAGGYGARIDNVFYSEAGQTGAIFIFW